MRGKKLEEGEEGIEQELARVKELLTTLSKVSGLYYCRISKRQNVRWKLYLAESWYNESSTEFLSFSVDNQHCKEFRRI
jgi:hypothetical protein